LTADFGSDAVKKEYSFNSRTWYTYTGSVVLNSNSAVYFRGTDHLGNVSEVSRYDVANIDKKAPNVPGSISVTVVEESAAVDWAESADSGIAGVKGYFCRYGNTAELSGNGVFVSESNILINDLEAGTWYYQIAAVDGAGNVSQWSQVGTFEIAGKGPEGLQGDAEGLSWEAVPGASGYVVEYSSDDFATVISVETETCGLDSFALPGTTFKWRVRALESDIWSYGDEITGKEVSGADRLVSDADGTADLFFGTADGVWEKGFAAQHQGDGSWIGTFEMLLLEGKNKVTDIFSGSSDANVLVLTDDSNGDALFADDICSALGGQARLSRIDEIRAGAGDDIVDLTSRRFSYSGDGVKVRGGLGNDTIWAGNGSNTLFGDAGDDRIIGGSGSDIIAGGSGDDSLHGGGGDDIFTFGGSWGNDLVEQTAAGSVTLWFEAGSADNWNAETLTYADGNGSVTVKGAASVTLKFGADAALPAGVFSDEDSRKVFEESNGFIA
jgi:hypothetical protein